MNLQEKNKADKSNQSLTISFQDLERSLSHIVSNASSSDPDMMGHYSAEIDGIITLIIDLGCPSEFLQLAQASRRKIDTLWIRHYPGRVVVGSATLEFDAGEGRK